MRLRHYVCPECGTPVGNREVAMKRLNEWLRGRPPQPEATGFFKVRKKKEETPSIICVGCEQRVPLWDELEQCFASPEIQPRVRDMQEESAIEPGNQSKERALVGQFISTVALADPISREFNVSDQGIDMEIEFNPNSGIETTDHTDGRGLGEDGGGNISSRQQTTERLFIRPIRAIRGSYFGSRVQ